MPQQDIFDTLDEESSRRDIFDELESEPVATPSKAPAPFSIPEGVPTQVTPEQLEQLYQSGGLRRPPDWDAVRKRIGLRDEQAGLLGEAEGLATLEKAATVAQEPLIPAGITESAIALSTPALPPGVRRSVAEAASGLTSPVNIGMAAVGGGASAIPRIGGAVARGIAGGFAADIATHIPELGTVAGEASVTGTPEEQQKAIADIWVSALMGGLAGGGALARPRPAIPPQFVETMRRVDAEVPGALNRSLEAAVKKVSEAKVEPVTKGETPNAIQEQVTDPSLLRQERPDVELQEVREPQVETALPREPARAPGGEEGQILLRDAAREQEIEAKLSTLTARKGRWDAADPRVEPLKAEMRALKAKRAENFEVSVQAEDPANPGTGFVQIVDTAVKAENVKSPTVESLRASGVDVPDFSKLPTGKYTWKEAIEKTKETTKTQTQPGVGGAEQNTAPANNLAPKRFLPEPAGPKAGGEQPTPAASQAVPDAIEVQAIDPQSGAPIGLKPAVVETPAPIGQGAGGAMRAGELEPPKPFKTSNKNRTVDAERKARGLEPMMDLERRSNQSAWDEAMRKIDERPEVQDELIAELGETPRALTPDENAMVTHRRVDLRNEYEKALHRWKEAFEGDDMVRAGEESARVKEWSNKLADLEDVTKATGAESGRSLQARKMMANEDFTLAAMELRAREAKGGNLSAQEHIELIKAQENIADLQRQIDALESGREGKEVETQTAETMKEVEREAKTKPKDPAAASEEVITGRIKARLEKGEQNAITPLVQQLARMLWQRGVRGQKPMVDGLHEILKTIDPEFTRDQTQRAFSGYGDFTPLSKAEIDVGLRDLKGQTQQVLKIEALEARKPLEKTGQERRVPSDEERRLIKQVNELKRKYGVVVTDPATQLKSALQSRKTYYEHRIADLKHEIETRERIVKTKSPSPTDAELDLMIAEKDRLQSEHDSIFPKREITDEQKLKQAIAAADRNLAQWEVRLTNAEKGVFDSRVPGRKVTSPELELIQAETAAIREHVKELKNLDAAAVEQKRTAALESQKATLEKQIAEQERKLREGDLQSPSQRQNRPADPLLEELMQKRDALNKQLAEARKKPEAQKYAEAQQRQLEKLNKSIDERLAKVAAGDISPIGSPKKVNRPMSPELEQARQQLEAVNSQLADLRKQAKPVKTPEEIALQSLKTRMASQTVAFRKRLAEGDFSKRERKPVALDAEANRLKAERDLAKEEFQAGLEKDRWEKTSVFGKTKARAGGVYDLVKTLMSTGEFSFVLRQGKGAFLEAIFSPKRAVVFGKAFRDGIRAMKSPLEQRTIENAIFNDPMYSQAVRDKLYVPEHGSKLSRQEEFMIGRYSDAIPGVSAFNRAAETFLKKLRFDNYKLMSKAMTESGTPTPAEGKIIAQFINEQTGRGGLGKAEPAAVLLNRALFSPRYLMSRLQLASGHQLWAGPWKGTGRARKAVAASYARMLVGAAAYYTGLYAFFNRDDKEGTLETDFRSSDAGKFKMGDTRLDPMAGLAQVATMAERTITGEAKDSKGRTFPIVGDKIPFGKDDWFDYAARFARSKLHPALGGTIDLRLGKNMVGEETTVTSKLTESGPMTYYDIYEALRAQDMSDGAALALLGLLGEGLQTYKGKPPTPNPNP